MKKSRTQGWTPSSVGPTTPKSKTPSPATEGATFPTDLDSVLSTTKKSLELVEWRDANFYVNDDPFDGEYINATVGWTEEEDKWLKISSELTPDGERAVTRVPLENVLRRRAISPSPSTWTTWPEPTE